MGTTKVNVERSTMPNTIARIAVVRIERIIPPLFLMTKKTVTAKPAGQGRTVGLLN